jgi:hypothetical protein
MPRRTSWTSAAEKHLMEGFVLLDAADRLVLCNRKYKELYRESSDAFVPGTPFEDMLRAGLEHDQCPDATGREELWPAERLAAHRSSDDSLDQRLAHDREVHVVGRRTANLECAPRGGRFQAAGLTVCWACWSSNCTGLRYPSAEWSLRAL